MVIKITLSNRALYSIITLGILIFLGIGVYAYGTNSPSVFGHTWEEIEITNSFCQIITGHECGYDNGILGSLNCNLNEIPKWSGNSWACGTDDIGVASTPPTTTCTTSTERTCTGDSVLQTPGYYTDWVPEGLPGVWPDYCTNCADCPADTDLKDYYYIEYYKNCRVRTRTFVNPVCCITS